MKLVNLIAIILAITILFITGIMLINNLKPKTAQRSCLNNLKILSIEFLRYSYDHHRKYPFQISTNKAGTKEMIYNPNKIYESFIIPKYMINDPKILKCPIDYRRSENILTNVRNTNISYFITLNAKPNVNNMTLFGDRNIRYTEKYKSNVIFTNNGARYISWDAKVGLHGNYGNIIFTDGHIVTTNRTKNRAILNNEHLNSILRHPANDRAIIGIP